MAGYSQAVYLEGTPESSSGNQTENGFQLINTCPFHYWLVFPGFSLIQLSRRGALENVRCSFNGTLFWEGLENCISCVEINI